MPRRHRCGDLFQRLSLCFQIGFRVVIGGVEAHMPKPTADDRDVYARRYKMDGGGVTEAVRRYVLRLQRRRGFSRGPIRGASSSMIARPSLGTIASCAATNRWRRLKPIRICLQPIAQSRPSASSSATLQFSRFNLILAALSRPCRRLASQAKAR